MATGYLIKMPDGSTKQVPFDQASQYADPSQLSLWNQKIGLPSQQLDQGVASLQSSAAELPGKQASSNVAVNTQGADIQKAQAEAAAAAKQAEQNQFMRDVTNNFTKAAKDNNGAVPAQYYNEVQKEAPQFGIDSKTFDGYFRQQFVDTTKETPYNTDQGNINKDTYTNIKHKIQAQLDAYNTIPAHQKGLLSKGQFENVPYLSSAFAPEAASYMNFVKGLPANLEQIVGAGAGTNVRVSNAELSAWSKLLPDPAKSQRENDKNLEQLDANLKATFNIDSGLDSQYLPGKQVQGPDGVTYHIPNSKVPDAIKNGGKVLK